MSDSISNYATYYPMAQYAAKVNNVPEKLFTSLIMSESNFNPTAKSSTSSANGIAQILDSTAKNPGYGLAPVNSSDPTASLDFGAKYLGVLYKKAVESGLTGNDAWAGAVSAYKGNNPDATASVMKSAGMDFNAQNNTASVNNTSSNSTNQTDTSYAGEILASIKNFVLNSAIGLTIGIVGLMLIIFSFYSILMKNKTIQSTIQTGAKLAAFV